LKAAGVVGYQAPSAVGTIVRAIPVGPYPYTPYAFPFFQLVPTGTTAYPNNLKVRYRFGMVSPANIADYCLAIRLAGTIADVEQMIERRVPTFTTNDGQIHRTWGTLDHLTAVTVSALPATAVGDPFTAPTIITFNINASAKLRNTVFAFTFSIPVFALSNLPSTIGEAPEKWYIRPGFGPLRHELDTGASVPIFSNGAGSTGGAVMLGTLEDDEYMVDWLSSSP
jgi:hypothetical protein